MFEGQNLTNRMLDNDFNLGLRQFCKHLPRSLTNTGKTTVFLPVNLHLIKAICIYVTSSGNT